jgi:SAM-dependent methyltransferase
MNFSKEWDICYKENKQMSIWPWSDLVSYVMRYSKLAGNDFHVLELGCGAGANIPFFKHLGVHYYSIEGSENIVKVLRGKYPEYKKNIVIGDFTKNIPFKRTFDLIFDRAAITHNSDEAIRQCIQEIYQSLKKGGKFIGIDWFSTRHSDYKLGIENGDEYTKSGIEKGQFVNVGKVHFSDKNHLLDLFSRFSIEIMEHKVINKTIPESNHIFATWNFAAIKK